MPFRDAIRIRNLQVDCVVGVYPDEREAPQPLLVDLEIRLDTERAARDERLPASVDYAAVAAQTGFLLRSCRFRMLETAGRALCRYLLLPPAPGERERARAESVRVSLSKPGALSGAAVPSFEMERGAGWLELRSEPRDFGTLDIVAETREAGVYRLNLAPGASICSHLHRERHELEMILSSGLLCQGRPVPAGAINNWPRLSPHGYHNPTDRHQTILCVACPPCYGNDEIAV
jgi:dihydroneopterin aldolase